MEPTVILQLAFLLPFALLAVPLVGGLVLFVVRRDAWALSSDRLTAPVRTSSSGTTGTTTPPPVPRDTSHTRGTLYVLRGTMRDGTPYAIRGVYHDDPNAGDFDPERTLYGYQAPLPSVAAIGGTVNLRGGR